MAISCVGFESRGDEKRKTEGCPNDRFPLMSSIPKARATQTQEDASSLGQSCFSEP